MLRDEPKLPTISADDGKRAGSSLVALAGLLTATALLGGWMASHVQTILFAGFETLLGWCALCSIAQVAGGNRTTLRQLLFITGGLALLVWMTYPAWRTVAPAQLALPTTLNNLAFLVLGAAVLLHFFASYAKLVAGSEIKRLLHPTLPLARLASIASASTAAVLFLVLTTSRDFANVLGYVFAGLALVLVSESLLRLSARFYQPMSHRNAPTPLGTSFLLETFGGSERGARGPVEEIEKLFGVKLREFWMIRFLSKTAGAILLAGVILAWLSTCLTAVPLGSKGVLVSFGRYAPGPLLPGLHVTLPWPLEVVSLVQTESIKEIALGLEQDLAGPVLWTQRHYVGEQNLLVGDGESLLTIDVPVDYQISDPVAFLTASENPVNALKSIAQRDLVRAAQSRRSFEIMTVDRAQIATTLKENLQRDVDRLKLGLRIVYVGLKDVHPPVDVAPAYEKVVSAGESKEAAIDLANAYEVSVLPDAQAAASRLALEAEASATQRVDQATGESSRFAQLALAEQQAPGLFRLRWRYDVLSDGLVAPAKVIVGLSGDSSGTYLDLRGGRDLPAPATSQPAPAPSIGRSPVKEVIEH